MERLDYPYGLLGESSMAAGNGVSEKPGFSGPGSPSEQTAGESAGNVYDPVDTPVSDHRQTEGG